FSGCSGLTTLDVSNFDTSRVTNMASMFSGCSGLTTLDVSNFDTSKVTNMGGMFYACSSLKSLDLSNFNSVVGITKEMFNACSDLEFLNLSNLKMGSNGCDSSFMFTGCPKLISIDIRSADPSKMNKQAIFNGCNSLSEVYTGNQTYANVFNASRNYMGCVSSCQFISVAPVITLSVDNQCTDLVTIVIPDLVEGGITKLTLQPVNSSKTITSFKLNGETITGNSFIAPMESCTVEISDVVLVDS
ncbi:MAG: BspA family leucine-rich repeat surface protein, partial [Lachnospiraceae bacterium]